MEQNKKIMVIGLDGATFDFIDIFRREGRLPHIDALIQSGVRASLLSTTPPNSAAAWPSFFTGKNPGKHGIYHFMNFRDDSYEPKIIDARDIRSPRIWNLLEKHNQKSLIINVPITYPPQEINGLMVSGMLTPSEDKVMTYPHSLHSELIAQTGFWPLERHLASLNRAERYIEGLDLLYRATEKQRDVLLYLMKKYEWNLLMTVFRGTDLVQHLLLRQYLDETHEKIKKEFLKFDQVIPQFYEKLDSIIGELLNAVSDDTKIILMSDHGCGPIYGVFALNRWLYEEGFLRLRRGANLRKLKANLRWISLEQIMGKLGLEIELFKESVFAKVLTTRWPVLRRQVEESWRIINWSKTKVYGCLGGDSMILLRLNLKGREPNGAVTPGPEEEELKAALKKKLLSLTHPSTGELLVEKVHESDDVYSGPLVKFAPDLIGVFKDFKYIATGRILKRKWFEESASGQHRMEGILVMRGDDICRGVQLPPCGIVDLAPTILHLMGLAVPSDMDGRVIEDALDPSFLKKNPVQYEDPQAADVDQKIFDAGRDRKDEQEIVELLKGLGYID